MQSWAPKNYSMKPLHVSIYDPCFCQAPCNDTILITRQPNLQELHSPAASSSRSHGCSQQCTAGRQRQNRPPGEARRQDLFSAMSLLPCKKRNEEVVRDKKSAQSLYSVKYTRAKRVNTASEWLGNVRRSIPWANEDFVGVDRQWQAPDGDQRAFYPFCKITCSRTLQIRF